MYFPQLTQMLRALDSIPRGMECVSADHLGVASQGVVVWTLPPLPSGESHLVEVTYRATVRATCIDPVSAAAQTTVRGIRAVLLEVIDVEDSIEVGSYETYVVRTTNQGTRAGTNMSIVCLLEDIVCLLEDKVEYYRSG